MIFDYPDDRANRRHGPVGYANYENYRPWLRDEFDFRCVYCLEREVWTKKKRAFEIDHVSPVSKSEEHAKLDYDNLVYACARCNSVKSDQSVSDPFYTLTKSSIVIDESGKAVGTTRESRLLIRKMDLNSDCMIQWRCLKLEHAELAKGNSQALALLTRLPGDLPDLAALNPRQNSRPDGILHSWKAKQERN